MAATVTKRQPNVTGRKLRTLRLNRGLSPEALGARIGVSGRTVRRVEEGAIPTVRTMFAYAEWAEKEVIDLWRL